jgi:putative transposase
MIVLEFKAYGQQSQFNAVDEAICTVQFIGNKALRLWMDEREIGKYDLSKYVAQLADEFPANQLDQTLKWLETASESDLAVLLHAVADKLGTA